MSETDFMHFRQIEVGSSEYQQELLLRDQVLRKPLGMSIDQDDLSREPSQLHFGLFDERGQLLASLIAVPVSAGVFQFRQMAVSTAVQNGGLGRRLIGEVEAYLQQESPIEIFLHARLTAAGFYEKLGYTRSGPEFIEIGIPHVNMRKQILPACE